MITQESIKEFTKKFQTRPENIIREYLQNLFLSVFFNLKGSEKFLFKGGTALRLIFQSPRFSEDLDFSSSSFFRQSQIEDLIIKTLEELEKMGIKVKIGESKMTSGGYLGIISFQIYNFAQNIQIEISHRRSQKIVKKEITTIFSELVPAYTLIFLEKRKLIEEKIQALKFRRKPRDYYDLYFLLRHPALNKFIDKKGLKNILKILKQEKINFKKELSLLLPVSHHLILKDFKNTLGEEIKKYIV